MKANFVETNLGAFVAISYQSRDGVEKEVKLKLTREDPLSLDFTLRASKEYLQDVVDLINKEGNP